MNDELISSKNQPIVNASQSCMDISGGNNTIFGQVGTVDNRSNVLITGGQANRPGVIRTNWEYDYYNLFVVGGESFSQFSTGDCIVPKEDALTRFVADDIAEERCKLDDVAINRVMGLFCIFASRNENYAQPGCVQNAFLGVITEIQRQDEGFKIIYQTLNPIPQSKIFELRDGLNIEGKPTISELDDTHWSVKKVNLVETLKAAGISCFLPG